MEKKDCERWGWNMDKNIEKSFVEKISLGTHLPHLLWVITPSRISGLTPDLSKERLWKENSSLLYPHLSLLQESELGEDFSQLRYSVPYLTCRVCAWHWTSGRLYSYPMKGRWREAGGFFFFFFLLLVFGLPSKQEAINVTLWVYLERS